jgi:hypothetical protein
MSGPSIDASFKGRRNMNQRQLLQQWNFPHLVHGGVTLIARENAEQCLRTVIEQRCHLHGYDGFTLYSDGRIQPHAESNASWSWDDLPPLPTMLRDVLDSPAEVTHFEFVFSGAA